MNKKLIALRNKTEKIRKEVIKISYNSKAHHIGSELSCLEILVSLYFDVMNINPKKKIDARDNFILSKGHAALALYVVLAEIGFYSYNYLEKNFLTNGGKLGGHPDRNEKLGIDFCSGSLGHGLSIAAGMALSDKINKSKKNIFVLLGDGELNEGMIWESVLFCSHHKLNNLYAVIDSNNLQGFGFNTDVLNLDPIDEKFISFGWNVQIVNGHNLKEIILAFKKFKKNNKPNLLIAKTVKGKGINFLENKLESHYKVLNYEEYKNLI